MQIGVAEFGLEPVLFLSVNGIILCYYCVINVAFNVLLNAFLSYTVKQSYP